jgi:hypothetical protein
VIENKHAHKILVRKLREGDGWTIKAWIFTEMGSENGVWIYVDLTGIGYTTFEPLFLAVGNCSVLLP